MARAARALFVGRFQPFHQGHRAIVDHLLKQEVNGQPIRGVVIGIGSSQVSHTLHDPMTAGERHEVVTASVHDLIDKGIDISILPIPDLNHHSLWVSHVVALCPRFSLVFTNTRLDRTLFLEAGYPVADSYYLRREVLSATSIRQRMTEGQGWEELVMPAAVPLLEELGIPQRLKDLLSTEGEGRSS